MKHLIIRALNELRWIIINAAYELDKSWSTLDDEPFDASWMDINAYNATRIRR